MINIYFRLFLIGFVVGLLLAVDTGANGQDMSGGESLFSDIRAHRIGDVVTIYIIEYSQGSNEANSKNSKESKVGASTEGDGLFKFIPLGGFGASNNVDFEGKGNTNRTGQLRAKMTARIKSIDANGNYVIDGHRELGVNNERQIMTLTGVVRPQDISSANIIMSDQIADAKISYKGKGQANDSQKQGLLTRLVNWIF